jgi:hypothetical protein
MITNESKTAIFAAVSEPFAAAKIQWRVGARSRDKTMGQVLPYLDVMTLQQRLDTVFGNDNWTMSYGPAPLGNGVLRIADLRVAEQLRARIKKGEYLEAVQECLTTGRGKKLPHCLRGPCLANLGLIDQQSDAIFDAEALA